MDADARKKELIALDGDALTKLAWELGLRPDGVEWPEGCAYAYDAEEHAWRPWSRIAQADAVFRSLRARGYTTSCCWFGDDRQYGDAWVGGIGDWCGAYGVRWPLDVATEALALLCVSVLAVEGARAAAARDQRPTPEEPLC